MSCGNSSGGNSSGGNSHCSRCGAPFTCAMADGGQAPCWCRALAPVAAVPDADARCWCPACLNRHAAQESASALFRDGK